MSDDPRDRRRAGTSAARLSTAGERALALADDLGRRLGRRLQVVDLGGGSGGSAVPLARAGHHVTVVDPSLDALASLARRAHEVGVGDLVTGLQGDAAALADLLPVGRADLLCCHDVLEYVDDPAATLADVRPVLASGGVLSLVVAQRLAVVLARALVGRFEQARHAVESGDGRWGDDDPLPRRFDADQVRGLVTSVGLDIVETRGLRLFADLVPAAMLDSESDRSALHALETAVAAHPEYAFLANVAPTLHVVARRP